MSAITLKSVSEDLIEALKERASGNHRSLSGEILFRLKKSLENEARPEAGLRDEAAIQADAWEKLDRSWISEESVDEEIAALYAGRSMGRDGDLNW